VEKSPNNPKSSENEEPFFKEILYILNQYKWSILFITLISSLLSYTYLYFKPSLYRSQAIIKVKPNIENIINNTISTVKLKDVKEEISLLSTFKINNHA